MPSLEKNWLDDVLVLNHFKLEHKCCRILHLCVTEITFETLFLPHFDPLSISLSRILILSLSLYYREREKERERERERRDIFKIQELIFLNLWRAMMLRIQRNGRLKKKIFQYPSNCLQLIDARSLRYNSFLSVSYC